MRSAASFDLTWEFGGQVSWVSVRLTGLSDGGSRLQLEHTAQFPDDFWNQFDPDAVGAGWDLAMVGLGRHLENGATMERKQATIWSMSQEGRESVNRSSDGWCRASIAAGTPESAAHEAAGGTTEFYTGQG
jgi:hypothetical protein